MRVLLPYFLLPFLAIINLALINPNNAWARDREISAVPDVNSKDRSAAKDPAIVVKDPDLDAKDPGSGAAEPVEPVEVEPSPTPAAAGSLMVGSNTFASPAWNDKRFGTSIPVGYYGGVTGSQPGNTGTEPPAGPDLSAILPEVVTYDAGKMALEIYEPVNRFTLGSDELITEKTTEMNLVGYRQ